MIEKLLIVDDNEGDRYLMKHILSQAGYSNDFQMAETGEAAVEHVKHNDPDLIILDTLLPGIDGFKTCEEIKRIKPEAKVVLLTGAIEALDEVKARNAGADEYTVKGTDYKALCEIFERINGPASRLEDS